MSEQHTPRQYTIVAVAASAGGIQGLGALLGGLGPDLSVPVPVVKHLDPTHRTLLAEVLSRRTEPAVKLTEDQEKVEPGTVCTGTGVDGAMGADAVHFTGRHCHRRGSGDRAVRGHALHCGRHGSRGLRTPPRGNRRGSPRTC